MSTKRPYAVEVQAGKVYSWCTCGFSESQPLCDGSHRGKSELKSYKWTASQDGTVLFCGCRQTQTPPFCDGSHTSA